MAGGAWRKNRGWAWTMGVALVVAIAVGVLGADYLTPDCEGDVCPSVERLRAYRPAEPAKIFDRDGELAGQLSGPRRIVVEFDSVPRLVKDAFVAVEDRRFREHGGVDLMGAARAFVRNVRSTEVEEGASTITMQLARNVFGQEVLDYNRWHRKATEIRLAREIEDQLTKDEILHLYLNQIYLGDGVYGVETAARHYFGKPVSDVNLTEAALLVGLAKNPEGYNPRNDTTAARQRIGTVLDILAREGVVGETEAAEARDGALDLVERPSTSDWGANAYYLSAVRRQLREIFPEPADRPGLRVYTGLDQRAQAAALDALTDQIRDIEAGRWGTFRHQAAPAPLERASPSPYLQGMVVAMRPESGLVTTLVGGRDYEHSEFDRAFQAKRQPGSAFKPIVYLAALGRGLRLSDEISTERLRMARRGMTDWAPSDHVSGESLTVRDALVFSSNTAAVRVGQRVGVDRVADQARAMGITSEIPRYPSAYLGAADVVPAELVAAYAVFGNGGRSVTPHLIERIEDAHGHEVYRARASTGRAADSRLSFLVLDMLRDVTTRGTGWRISRAGLNVPAAGKTGTTNDSRDLWFVGLTPDLVAGVWIGFDDPRTVVPDAGGGDLAAPVWARFMGAAASGGDSAAWQAPPGVTQVKVDSETGRLWNEFCSGQPRSEYFLSGSEPRAECRPDDPYWYRTADGEWAYDTVYGGRWDDEYDDYDYDRDWDLGSDSAREQARDPDRYRTRFYRGDETEEDRERRRERLREDRERRLDSLDAARERERSERRGLREETPRDTVRVAPGAERDLDAARRNQDRIRPADTTDTSGAGAGRPSRPDTGGSGGGPAGPPPDDTTGARAGASVGAAVSGGRAAGPATPRGDAGPRYSASPTTVGASAVSSTGGSASGTPWWASQRSASRAAMQPVPAAVTAWR